MTREEYLVEVDRISDAYVQAAKDYIEALREENFKKCAEISFGTLDILGPKLSAYITEKVMALDEYDDIVDGYIKKSREIEEQLVVNE